MARPIKNNADYFPHDADMRNDPKIKAIRRKFGQLHGYAMYVMLLEYLSDKDYFKVKLSDLEYELIAGDFGIDDPVQVKEFVSYACMLDLFQMDDDVLSCRSLLDRMDSLLIKRKRDNLRVKFKDEVFERDGHECLKCGSLENLTIDHIVPVSKGGIDEMDNLQTLCKTCNLSKKTNIADYRSENTQSKGKERKGKENKGGDKQPVNVRLEIFRKSLDQFLFIHGTNRVNAFIAYWTELNPSGSKMRFEGEKYFDVGKRLATWEKNESKFSNGNDYKKQSYVSPV